jgi:cell division septum initiation protein DivIVA
MRSGYDLLYTLFEQHLFNALVEEETSDAFLDRVVREYIRLLSARGMIPHEHLQTIESDLRDEVLEMLRKKTYGHYNLTEFRNAKRAAMEEPAEKKERRGRRVS